MSAPPVAVAQAVPAYAQPYDAQPAPAAVAQAVPVAAPVAVAQAVPQAMAAPQPMQAMQAAPVAVAQAVPAQAMMMQVGPARMLNIKFASRCCAGAHPSVAFSNRPATL